jgi:hypothetical protein
MERLCLDAPGPHRCWPVPSLHPFPASHHTRAGAMLRRPQTPWTRMLAGLQRSSKRDMVTAATTLSRSHDRFPDSAPQSHCPSYRPGSRAAFQGLAYARNERFGAERRALALPTDETLPVYTAAKSPSRHKRYSEASPLTGQRFGARCSGHQGAPRAVCRALGRGQQTL